MVATFKEGIDVVIDLFKRMENEIRRLTHTKRKGDGVNFDRLVYKTRTDLSDRSKRLFRMTFQIEVIIFAEAVP